MRAIEVTRGQLRSACLLDVAEPGLEMGGLVQTLAIGICEPMLRLCRDGTGSLLRGGSDSLLDMNQSVVSWMYPRPPISHE